MEDIGNCVIKIDAGIDDQLVCLVIVQADAGSMVGENISGEGGTPFGANLSPDHL